MCDRSRRILPIACRVWGGGGEGTHVLVLKAGGVRVTPVLVLARGEGWGPLSWS